MNLSKRDALFLYKVLYHFAESQRGFSDIADLEDFLDRLDQFLLSSEEPQEDEDEEEVEEVEEEEYTDEENPEADSTLTITSLGELPSLKVTAPDGSKVSLEFEDVGESESIDALLDGGDVIVDSVTHIRVTNSTIDLFDGEEWHSYGYKRLTKQWSDTFTVDNVYDIEA